MGYLHETRIVRERGRRLRGPDAPAAVRASVAAMNIYECY